MDQLYAFVYRGLLADTNLDRVGRKRRKHFGADDAHKLRQSLSFEMLDPDRVADAQRMSIVYTAIHAFENSVRQLVLRAMAEAHGEEWWSKVSSNIQSRVKTRMEEDAKFRYHTPRGATEMMYCDFGDLSLIIVAQWQVFETVLVNQGFAKSILDTLERARNIIMHGGMLAQEDIERVGMNIRDWIRQTG
jgi:Swt1-like HEPN